MELSERGLCECLIDPAPRHFQEKCFSRLTGDASFLLAHCLSEPRGASDLAATRLTAVRRAPTRDRSHSPKV